MCWFSPNCHLLFCVHDYIAHLSNNQLLSSFCFFRLLHFGIYGISSLNYILLNHIKMKYSRWVNTVSFHIKRCHCHWLTWLENFTNQTICVFKPGFPLMFFNATSFLFVVFVCSVFFMYIAPSFQLVCHFGVKFWAVCAIWHIYLTSSEFFFPLWDMTRPYIFLSCFLFAKEWMRLSQSNVNWGQVKQL